MKNILRLSLLFGLLALLSCTKSGDIECEPWYEPGMRGKTYINNGKVQVGVDLENGGCIFHISEVTRKTNLVNHHDIGRYLQQSYYGDLDGSVYEGIPWNYNPIQGGSWYSKVVGKVVSVEKGRNRITVESIPVHYIKGHLLEECRMKEEISLEGDIVKIRFSIRYNGEKRHEAQNQEIPSFYPNFEYCNLVWYAGARPWTRGALKSIEVEPALSIEGINKWIWQQEWTEKWAAYVDKNNWGIGLYSPSSTYCTYYRFGDGTSVGPNGNSVSYFAPLIKKALVPGQEIAYDSYVTIGDINDIRDRFYNIRNNK